MGKYKWKYMDETSLNEMDVLLKGEHGSTLKLWSMECANATSRSIAKGIIKGAVIGTVLGIIWAEVEAHKRKRAEKIEEPVEAVE